MKKPLILLVDDDASLRTLIALRLEANGFDVAAADSGEAALAMLAHARPDAVLTDIQMPGMDGMALFRAIHARDPALPVIVLTAHGTIPDAVAATQQGLFGYLTKPYDAPTLVDMLNRATRLAGAKPAGDIDAAWRADIVTASAAMERLLAEARLAAQSEAPLLILGESGTGKEVLARAVHRASPRRDYPFVAINCGAIPDALIHAALFGHERGAFTGADRQAPGVFEQAHRGTLFLDEVGELSAQAQASLLRVLETGTLVRLGGSQAVAVDVRVVAATHRDLEERCRAGAFREDLWYRLNALTLTVPPLRDRPEELRPLVDRFLAAAAAATGRAGLTIDDDALACLAAYAWPGNVRELRNELERAAVLASGDVIGRAELSERILRAAGVTPADGEAADDGDGEDAVALPRGAGGDLKTRVERFEAELLRQALAAADGHQPTAATALGLPLRTLVYKLRKHGLQRGR